MLLRVIKLERPTWLRKIEKSSILKGRELYLEEYVIEHLDEEEVFFEDFGFLSS